MPIISYSRTQSGKYLIKNNVILNIFPVECGSMLSLNEVIIGPDSIPRANVLNTQTFRVISWAHIFLW